MTTAGPKPVETTAAYEPRIPETGYPQRPRLVLVTCAGRSGSKWMLRLFDFHPETLCRNEPERMTPALKDPATTSWEEWERTAMDVGPRIGFVDRPPAKPKAYMRGWVKTSRADRVLYTRTLQKITGRHPEAKFPRVFYDADAVARAQRVLNNIYHSTGDICVLFHHGAAGANDGRLFGVVRLTPQDILHVAGNDADGNRLCVRATLNVTERLGQVE